MHYKNGRAFPGEFTGASLKRARDGGAALRARDFPR